MTNIRKKIGMLIIAVLIIDIINPLYIAMAKEPYISARCAIALDAKTKVPLYEKNSEILVPIASTTKILTSLVAIKYGNLDKQVEISARSANIKGSTVGYKKGELITIRELLYGLMLRSGNDAAIAIAEGISGSVEEFVKLMNEYSAEIGLTNSHFETPHGLDKDYHYSTAYDLALVTAKAREYELFNEIVASKDVDGKSKGFTRSYHNINKILWQIQDANGVKTGYTGKAGKCLVTSVNLRGNDVIIVILNCNERWRETKKIYDYVMANYEYKKFCSKGDVMTEVPLKKGKLKLIAGEDIVLPVDKDSIYDKIVLAPKSIKKSINAGDSIGAVRILKNGTEIYCKSLYSENSIKPEGNILKFLFK